MSTPPLNETLIVELTQQLKDAPTPRLLDTWQENNRTTHSAEEFEAIRRILLSRNLMLPPQRNAAPESWDKLVAAKPAATKSSKMMWVIAIVVIAVLCLVCVLGGGLLYYYRDQLGFGDIQLFNNPTPQPTVSVFAPTVPAVGLATKVPVAPLATASPVKPDSMPDPAYAQWPVILSDDFNDNTNDWATGDDDNEFLSQSWELKNGLYQWHVTAKDTDLYWLTWPETGDVADFYLTLDVQKVNSPTSSDVGLFFRKLNDSSFYAYSVNDATGEYVVYTVVDNDWQELIPWTSDTAVRIGRPNKLGVAAVGDDLRFYINDRLVGQVTDSTFTTGGMGMIISVYYTNDDATFQFDNFELREQP